MPYDIHKIIKEILQLRRQINDEVNLKKTYNICKIGLKSQDSPFYCLFLNKSDPAIWAFKKASTVFLEKRGIIVFFFYIHNGQYKFIFQPILKPDKQYEESIVDFCLKNRGKYGSLSPIFRKNITIKRQKTYLRIGKVLDKNLSNTVLVYIN